MINFRAGPSTSSHLTEALKNKKGNIEDVEREKKWINVVDVVVIMAQRF